MLWLLSRPTFLYNEFTIIIIILIVLRIARTYISHLSKGDTVASDRQVNIIIIRYI